jgi:hypothetical protein
MNQLQKNVNQPSHVLVRIDFMHKRGVQGRALCQNRLDILLETDRDASYKVALQADARQNERSDPSHGVGLLRVRTGTILEAGHVTNRDT